MAVTLEEAKMKATKALEYLNTCDNYSTRDAQEAIRDLKGGVSVKSASTLVDLGQYLAKQGIAPLIVKIIRSLSSYNGKGLEQEHNLKSVWTIFVYLTCSPKLNDLILDFVKHGAIGLLMSMLEPSKHLDSDSELAQSIKILNILCNCVKHPDSIVRSTYRDSNAVPVLMKYLKSTEIMLQINSLTILAYIVNDKESDVIASTEDCVAHMVDMLKQAAQDDDGFVRYMIGGQSYSTGLYGLLGPIKRLVVNDANKREIVEHGGVPVITQIITRKRNASIIQQYAMEILWQLAFVDIHSKEITRHLKNTNTVEVLLEFQNSKHPAVREASTGLLWKLDLINVHDNSYQTKPQTPPPSYEEAVAAPHIFISYSWGNNQERVKKLRDNLQEAGFSVWMDIDKMSGSTLRAMAGAVEKSSLVLICASSAYHQSVNCEQEATYSYEKRKPIIPIFVEDNYKPDGWLGLLIAGKLYFKVCTDEMLKSQMPAIIREIKRLTSSL